MINNFNQKYSFGDSVSPSQMGAQIEDSKSSSFKYEYSNNNEINDFQ